LFFGLNRTLGNIEQLEIEKGEILQEGCKAEAGNPKSQKAKSLVIELAKVNGRLQVLYEKTGETEKTS